MTNQKRASLFALITLLTLLANLIFPTSVFADDETPPLPAPTEEIILDEEPAPPTDPQLDSVSEVLEQLPENTEVVVLDESGEPIPLVTEEAAEAIIIGDPVWCPSTLSAPTPGSNGCTSSYTSFQDLITYLDANEQALDGTIWIESSYNSSVNDAASSGFVFDGGSFTTMSNYALTLQGGWNGVSGSSSIGSSSLFSGDYLVVTNWNATVTINDITVDGTSGSHGIIVNTSGAVNLSNIEVQNSDLSGVYIDNQAGTNDVNISGTNNFSNNDNMGVLVYSRGNVSLNNATANNNTIEGGAYIDNSLGSGYVQITGSNVFNNNGTTGLEIWSSGNLNLNSITANQNGEDGVYLEICGCTPSDITITGANVFNNNGVDGLYVLTGGDINISNVTANENGFLGIELTNDGDIIGNGIYTSNNLVGLGIISSGEITISNIVANNNFIGADLDNTFSLFFDDIFVTNGQFNNNMGGLGVFSTGDIYIQNIISDGNISGSGLFADGTVTIKCSTFSNNIGDGITVDAPELNLLGVTFTNNTVDIQNLNPTSTVNIFDYNCNPSTNKPKPNSGTGLPLNIIQGNNADLDCDKFSGTVLILPNGDKVTFKCPIDGSATLNAVLTDALPNPLPDGVEYVSGMLATQSPDGSDVALDGLVVVSFIIPEDLKGSDFAILYWNGTEWVDLDTATGDTFNDDGRKVLNGGYVTEDGYFEALTNFTGNFVLVTK